MASNHIDIADVLIMARQKRPYYARALSALQPVATDKIPTMAVDRWWRLYYNQAWLDKIGAEMSGAAVGCHEVEHLLRRHAARRSSSNADPTIFNIAGDLEINDDWEKETRLHDCLLPAQFKMPDGLIAEEYYHELEKQNADKKQGQKPECGSGSGGKPIDGELQSDDKNAPGLSEEDGQILRDAVARDVIALHGKQAGNVHSGAIIWANEQLKPPRIRWQHLISQAISRVTDNICRGRQDYSYHRVSRRPIHGIIKAGLVQYRPTIGLIIDTSGSMAELGGVVTSETLALLRSFKVIALCNDTETTKLFHRGKIEFRGGGGTDLRVGIEELRKEVSLLIILTDGHTPWPDIAPRIPVIIGLLGDGETPNWATTIHIPIQA